jgi:hypothetical protein
VLTLSVHVDINIDMKADLIYRFEQDFGDGAMVRMVVWKVPSQIAFSDYSFKCHLVYL